MNKKELGAFYSTNVDKIFENHEMLIKDKTIIDPFCGEKDLLKWATKHGAAQTTGADINRNVKPDILINSILTPINYSVFDMVVTNPPYLLNNKTKNSKPFMMWKAKDLYKASLLSIAETANELLAIVPSNMFFDKDSNFRERFYSKMKIESVVCFDEQVFDDTTTRVCVIYATKGKTISLFGHELYNTFVGKDWYTLVGSGERDVKRLTLGNESNSRIKIRTTDTGSKGGEIKAYIDEPFFGKISDRNFMTIVLPENVTEETEREMVERFNSILNENREKYNSMFLTNFLAGKDKQMRKRITFRDALSLMSVINKEIKNDREYSEQINRTIHIDTER